MTEEEMRGRAIRRLRERRLWSRRELARQAGISPSAIAPIEEGRVHVQLSTIGKLAEALGVDSELLLYPEEHEEEIYPKGEAPTSPTPDREGEERRTLYDALRSLAMRKVADYDREVSTHNSPHFRDSTAAALWIADVQRDAAQWADWVIEEAPTLAPLQGKGSLKENILNALKVSGPLLEFDRVIDAGRRRLEAAEGPTDELAQRKLEKSTQRFKEVREALSA